MTPSLGGGGRSSNWIAEDACIAGTGVSYWLGGRVVDIVPPLCTVSGEFRAPRGGGAVTTLSRDIRSC